MRYDLIKELACANIEKIFTLWGLKFAKITPTEYDFISPFRKDNGFGACRFNTKKGRGADFAGTGVTPADFAGFGDNFDKSDFSGFTSGDSCNLGFDIISLCMRVNKIDTYYLGALHLAEQLNKIQGDPDYVKIDMAQVEAKKRQNELERSKKLYAANKTWDNAFPIKDTLGEVYLNSRAIHLTENHKNIKFHPAVINKELGRTLPVLLFKVSDYPGGELKAIHRIYLSPDGKSKAQVTNPKMALGDIAGSAIWLGRKSDTLCVAEGPENALSVLCLDFPFVCSTIGATNYSNIRIPSYVRSLILFPDNDRAGRENAQKAKAKFKSEVESIKVIYPTEGDFNDMLIKAQNESR